MRSQKFIKDFFRREVVSPIFWILLLSFLIQTFQSESTSLFGVNRHSSLDLYALGFSPEQPFRSYMLPWLFSAVIHTDWSHLAQNAALLLVIYFFVSKHLTSRNWWLLVVGIQLMLNFGLLLESQMQTQVAPANLYVGLSGICLGILSFAAIAKVPGLRIAAIVATLYEIYRLTETVGTQRESYAHLIALAIGYTIGAMLKRRRVFLVE